MTASSGGAAGHPVGRRVVLDLGRGTLAVALLSLAGCSTDSSTPDPSGAASSGPSGPSDATSSGPAPSQGSEAVSGGALTWNRVDLNFVSAYVLVRGKEATVVDTGVGGSADAIGLVLDQVGPGWAGVRNVILTHHHADHAGSIGDVLSRASGATGWVGEQDLAQVSAPGLKPVKDGDEVFGLRIIGTPGHTAGHVSVFDPATGLLVAGDALNNTAGLSGANPQYSQDLTTAAASVKKLAALPVRTLLFGHGTPLETDAAAQLKRLAGV